MYLLPLDSLNKPYNKLLHHHPMITPILFRGGKVYRSLKDAGLQVREIEVHPVLGSVICWLYDNLANVHVAIEWDDPITFEHLVDIPAVNEHLTKPPFSTVYWKVAINNSKGVTVGDFMEARGSLPIDEDCVSKGSYVVGKKRGCPGLQVTIG
jgi:hypothetical protein